MRLFITIFAISVMGLSLLGPLTQRFPNHVTERPNSDSTDTKLLWMNTGAYHPGLSVWQLGGQRKLPLPASELSAGSMVYEMTFAWLEHRIQSDFAYAVVLNMPATNSALHEPPRPLEPTRPNDAFRHKLVSTIW